MNQKLPNIFYPSLKQFVLSHLRTALLDCGVMFKTYIAENKAIPVHRGKNCQQVLYISGVALQIAKAEKLAASDVASSIARILAAQFPVQVIPPGWLHLGIHNPILAAWLESVTTGDVLTSSAESRSLQAEAAFAAQYTHARCCSWLWMAHREGLIALQEGGGTPVWSAPHPIPWLDCNENLLFYQAAEWALIGQLVQVVDDLYSSNSKDFDDWQRAALDLGMMVDKFWSSCRIWGDVKSNSLHLAQARLGLLMTAQRVLKFLLYEKLGISAPVEL